MSELPLGSGEGESYGDKVDISNGIHYQTLSQPVVAVRKGSFEGLAKRRGDLGLFIVEGPRRKIASKPSDYSWGSALGTPASGKVPANWLPQAL